MKKETVWFRCPAELKRRIEALAKQEGRTLSNMYVRLLDSAIDSYEAMANINHRSLKVTNIPPLPQGALESCINQIKALCGPDDVPDGAEAALRKARGL